MNKHFVSFSLAAAGLCIVSFSAFGQQPLHATTPAPAADAAEPVPEESFSFQLGRAVVNGGNGASSTYTIVATKDFRAKETGAKLRLTVLEKDAGGTSTHLLTINTGKYKTVAQLADTLAEIFNKYLSAQAADEEIGKIGDLGHGGEIHFYAESPGVLRYDWLAPGEPVHSTRFKRADIQAFVGLLHPKTTG